MSLSLVGHPEPAVPQHAPSPIVPAQGARPPTGRHWSRGSSTFSVGLWASHEAPQQGHVEMASAIEVLQSAQFIPGSSHRSSGPLPAIYPTTHGARPWPAASSAPRTYAHGDEATCKRKARRRPSVTPTRRRRAAGMPARHARSQVPWRRTSARLDEAGLWDAEAPAFRPGFAGGGCDRSTTCTLPAGSYVPCWAEPPPDQAQKHLSPLARRGYNHPGREALMSAARQPPLRDFADRGTAWLLESLRKPARAPAHRGWQPR